MRKVIFLASVARGNCRLLCSLLFQRYFQNVVGFEARIRCSCNLLGLSVYLPDKGENWLHNLFLLAGREQRRRCHCRLPDKHLSCPHLDLCVFELWHNLLQFLLNLGNRRASKILGVSLCLLL